MHAGNGVILPLIKVIAHAPHAAPKGVQMLKRLALFSLIASLGTANAAPITVDVNGTVAGTGSALSGNTFTPGNAFTLSLIVDTDTPDLVTSGAGGDIIGEYNIESIIFSMGSFFATYTSTDQGIGNNLVVLNDTGSGTDEIQIKTFSNSLSPIGLQNTGFDSVSQPVDGFTDLSINGLRFSDPTATLFSGDDLLGALFALSLLPNRSLGLEFDDAFPFGQIALNVDSVIVSGLPIADVPLPAALPLMMAGLAGLGLMSRRKKTFLAASTLLAATACGGGADTQDAKVIEAAYQKAIKSEQYAKAMCLQWGDGPFAKTPQKYCACQAKIEDAALGDQTEERDKLLKAVLTEYETIEGSPVDAGFDPYFDVKVAEYAMREGKTVEYVTRFLNPGAFDPDVEKRLEKKCDPMMN